MIGKHMVLHTDGPVIVDAPLMLALKNAMDTEQGLPHIDVDAMAYDPVTGEAKLSGGLVTAHERDLSTMKSVGIDVGPEVFTGSMDSAQVDHLVNVHGAGPVLLDSTSRPLLSEPELFRYSEPDRTGKQEPTNEELVDLPDDGIDPEA